MNHKLIKASLAGAAALARVVERARDASNLLRSARRRPVDGDLADAAAKSKREEAFVEEGRFNC